MEDSAEYLTNNNIKPVFDFSESNIGMDDFFNETDKLIRQTETLSENIGLFTVKPANKWINESKTKPIQKMLFGEFWFENEICILFADTNVGKSILAVQIGNSISKGINVPGFKLETARQPVLYFDFELSEKQFESRYAIKNEENKNHDNHFIWDINFLRSEINPDAEIPADKDFESYLHDSVEQAIIMHNVKILIIDNITYLRTENEKAKDALPLMKQLKTLKKKYGLSILVLAHTPKRDCSKPITRNDLSGSKMLINFCDSSFAIGESNVDNGLRYLKQIKARNIETIYDTENICVCQIIKPSNFLHFDFIDFGNERDHLKQLSTNDKEERTSKVLNLKSQGISNVEIARNIGVTEGAIRKLLKKLDTKT